MKQSCLNGTIYCPVSRTNIVDMKISIIIPVYNCQSYLRKLLSSFSNRTSAYELEIILVNDGSADESGAICDHLASLDNRIIVIHQSNQGAATARNRGLEIASGEWIWMIDADDTPHLSLLCEILPELKECNSDAICFNYQIATSKGIKSPHHYIERTRTSGLTYLEKHTELYVWNKIFRRSLIGTTRFLDGTKTIEDFLFCIEVLRNAKIITILPIIGYTYNCTSTHSTQRDRSRDNLIRTSTDSLTIHKRLYEICVGSDNQTKSVLFSLLNFSICGHLFSIFKYLDYKTAATTIFEYRTLGLYPAKPTKNRKANLFLKLANNQHLYLWAIKFGIGRLIS